MAANRTECTPQEHDLLVRFGNWLETGFLLKLVLGFALRGAPGRCALGSEGSEQSVLSVFPVMSRSTDIRGLPTRDDRSRRWVEMSPRCEEHRAVFELDAALAAVIFETQSTALDRTVRLGNNANAISYLEVHGIISSGAPRRGPRRFLGAGAPCFWRRTERHPSLRGLGSRQVVIIAIHGLARLTQVWIGALCGRRRRARNFRATIWVPVALRVRCRHSQRWSLDPVSSQRRAIYEVSLVAQATEGVRSGLQPGGIAAPPRWLWMNYATHYRSRRHCCYECIRRAPIRTGC